MEKSNIFEIREIGFRIHSYGSTKKPLFDAMDICRRVEFCFGNLDLMLQEVDESDLVQDGGMYYITYDAMITLLYMATNGLGKRFRAYYMNSAKKERYLVS